MEFAYPSIEGAIRHASDYLDEVYSAFDSSPSNLMTEHEGIVTYDVVGTKDGVQSAIKLDWLYGKFVVRAEKLALSCSEDGA